MSNQLTLKKIVQEFLQSNALYIEEFTSISDAAAEALAQHEGDLSLDGLTSLSDAAAEALAKHKGLLFLDGLTSLSDAVAKALAKHKGYLSLDGLTSLSDAAAQALAKHKGDSYLGKGHSKVARYRADITLEDLLNAESEVLRRIGDEQSSSGTTMSGHYSFTGGHSSSGGHYAYFVQGLVRSESVAKLNGLRLLDREG